MHHRHLLPLLAAGALALPAPVLAQDTGDGVLTGVTLLVLMNRIESAPTGIGTRVSGARETFATSAEVEEMIGLGGQLYIPLQNGRRLTLKLSRTTGEDSDRSSIPAGGPDDFGFTFLEPQSLSGGGTSTGLFVGNAWDVEATSRAEATHWQAGAEFSLGLDGPFTRGLSVGLTYDNRDQKGDAAGTFSSGASEIDSDLETRAREWAANMSMIYGGDWRLTPELLLWFKGEAGASVRNTEASAVQTTTCGFCAPDLQSVVQEVEVDDSRVLPTWGAKVALRYELLNNGALEVGVAIRNDGPAAFNIPANPDQQPAGFDETPTTTVAGWIAFDYRW